MLTSELGSFTPFYGRPATSVLLPTSDVSPHFADRRDVPYQVLVVGSQRNERLCPAIPVQDAASPNDDVHGFPVGVWGWETVEPAPPGAAGLSTTPFPRNAVGIG